MKKEKNVSENQAQCAIPSANNRFFYFINQQGYTISDIDCCAISESTIDINLHDIANNETLLNLLNLVYIDGNFGVTYTYESRAKWVCGYLSAFISNSERSDSMYAKALTNPTVRLLVTDDSLFEKVKKLLLIPKHKK